MADQEIRDFLTALSAAGVRHVVVGAYARNRLLAVAGAALHHPLGAGAAAPLAGTTTPHTSALLRDHIHPHQQPRYRQPPHRQELRTPLGRPRAPRRPRHRRHLGPMLRAKSCCSPDDRALRAVRSAALAAPRTERTLIGKRHMLSHKDPARGPSDCPEGGEISLPGPSCVDAARSQYSAAGTNSAF
jgi:hypothetical protein